jgi:toxin-antitoxin system PIN domain toxin
VLVLDVNVVLVAHRDDHPDHATLRRWFDDMLEGTERFSVPTVVWGSFLRLATKRGILDPPSSLSQAFAFIESVCAQPHYVPLEPGPSHLQLLRQVCEDSAATGDLVPDAVIAAIALEHGCAVASLDRDFARFSSIEHVIPGRS